MDNNPFVPHPKLFNGQLQTILAHALANPPPLGRYETDTITLSDGDQINLHIDRPEHATADNQVFILLHGLGGCSESEYILRIAGKLNSLGYPVIRFNHRGCGRGGAALARSIYHAGRTADIQSTLKHVQSTWANYKVSIAAFSLSANMLLRFLADLSQDEASKLTRALAVCPPIDLELCSLAISSRKNLHFDLYYTRRLIKTALEKRRLFPETPKILFPLTINLRKFDEIYTAKIAGYQSRDDYYTRSSSKPVLKNITTRTGIIYAEDDPIIPAASFADAVFSKSMTVYPSKHGGHMGFLARQPTKWGDRWWMDEAVIDFLLPRNQA